MRLSSLILATLAVILNYGVAVAQSAPATADYWMPGCRDAAALIHFSNDGDSKDDLVKMGFCVGIINGLSYAGVSSGLCVPNIDPPTSSYAIMRRARPYRGENTGPGRDDRGELDTSTRN